MTFSIVARDATTGDLAVAVQSKFLGVGAVVPWAWAGIGAVATQAHANTAMVPELREALDWGESPSVALDRLLADDPFRDDRQFGVVDTEGRAASFTGPSCFRWAGSRIGDGFAAQGNILTGSVVVDALVDTYVGGGRPFPELLVACLAAADDAGGDARGRQSAALLVVRAGGGYGGGNDRWIDLHVEDHPDPIGELGRVLGLHRLYFDRPTVDELVPVDAALGAELRARLTEAGHAPGGALNAIQYVRMSGEAETPDPDAGVGVARPLPEGWNDDWQRTLVDWMSVENLEERTASAGWIDPRVLAFLREHTAGVG